MLIYRIILAILVVLFLNFQIVQSLKARNKRSNTKNSKTNSPVTASTATSTSSDSNKTDTSAAENYVAQTKTNWTYQPSPRVGSLFIRTGENRTLYPGALNCGKNRITLSEFKSDLTIIFPSAKSNSVYTLVIYRDGFLARAIGNIKGEDLYEGRVSGYEVAELTDIEESTTDQVFFAEILEHCKDKIIPEATYNRNEWTTIWSSWQNEILNGSAGKTCFVIVSSHLQGSGGGSEDAFNDISILFQQFMTQSDL